MYTPENPIKLTFPKKNFDFSISVNYEKSQNPRIRLKKILGRRGGNFDIHGHCSVSLSESEYQTVVSELRSEILRSKDLAARIVIRVRYDGRSDWPVLLDTENLSVAGAAEAA